MENTFSFLWMHVSSQDRVTLHPFSLRLSTVCNLQVSLFCFALGCSSARSGLFQVVFHGKRNASHEFLFEIPDSHLCQSRVVSSLILFEQHLECTTTATARTALTVEADDHNKYF